MSDRTKNGRRKNNTNDLNVNVYTGTFKPGELEAMRVKLAKRANQRMLRLERAKSEITGESFAEFGAITQAREYLKQQYRDQKKIPDKLRFSENKSYSSDFNVLRREITELQAFLGAKSSLVSGQKAIEKKRIETFESGKWGASYKYTQREHRKLKFSTTKEFYNFLSSNTFTSLIRAGFSSERIVEIYDTAREWHEGDADKVLDIMEKALEEYREGAKVSLKDLTARLGMKKIEKV